MTRSEDLVAQVRSPTEGRNPRTLDIDRLPTVELLRLINDEDRTVPDAVAAALDPLAAAVDRTVDALRAGGRVHYAGAGTSGRLAALDVAELTPTYGVPPGVFCAHHAGGADAMARSVEEVEDDEPGGYADLGDTSPGDVVVGLTASGRTPYVAGALRRARVVGAQRVLVSSNPAAPLSALADVHVAVDTGPEAIAGSTRMKAGTAQKIVLTAFSTAVMVRLGRTYSNLMIAVTPSNAKLRGRAVRILAEATGQDADSCGEALAAAGGDLRTALVHLLTGASADDAAAALRQAGGVARAAVASLTSPTQARKGNP